MGFFEAFIMGFGIWVDELPNGLRNQTLLFPMKGASTKTMAAIDVENWLTHPLAIQFPPPVSVGSVFGDQECWAAFVYEGNQFFAVFRVRRVLS